MAEKKFKVINKSNNFIYFVTRCEENAEWHFNVGLKTAAHFWAWKYDKMFQHEISGIYVILQFKLSLRHQPNYMRLTACKSSPYKLKELDPQYQKEIKKAIIKDTLTYENEEIPYYDYALVLWEELNDREKFYLYETPNQEERWTNTPISMNETGLAMNVELAIQPSDYKEQPYVIVQNDYEEKHNMNWVKVRLDGTVIGDEELIFDEEVEQVELREWLEINKLPILMYWTGVEPSSIEIIKLLKTLKVECPNYQIDKKWESKRIIHAKELEEYFDSIRDKIIGKTIDRIFYTGILYNRHWDEYDFEYKNGEFIYGRDKKKEPWYYQWKDRDVSLTLDSPIILDFEGNRLEIEYWTGSLVNVNMNSINLDDYGADISKHFAVNIIGQKLIDIKIRKTDQIYFMNFSNLGVERKNGDDMFEQIWFVFENGYLLELNTDHCDYTQFCEVPSYVYYNYIEME